MRLLSAIVWAFGLMSLLWFAASFASLAALFGQPALSTAHALYGYSVAAVQVATFVGWVWALYRSVRGRSAVNGWTEAMCAATAAAQVVIIAATVAILGGWISGGRADILVGYALLATLLMASVRRVRRSGAAASMRTGTRA